MEWIVAIIPLGLLIVWTVARIHYAVQDRRMRSNGLYIGMNPRPIVDQINTIHTPAIPKAIREEIDQTPAWWDTQFHKLLATVDKPEVYEVEYVEEISFLNGATMLPAKVTQEYLGCTCNECKRARFRR